MIKDGLKTVIFGNSRLMVEVLTKYLKDIFDRDPRKAARVAAYRGGYLPTERRATERKLRSCTFGCPARIGPILASDQTRQYSPKAATAKVLTLLAHTNGT